jgi:hypothetical protein
MAVLLISCSIHNRAVIYLFDRYVSTAPNGRRRRVAQPISRHDWDAPTRVSSDAYLDLNLGPWQVTTQTCWRFTVKCSAAVLSHDRLLFTFLHFYIGHRGPPERYELMEPPPLNAPGVPATHSCLSSGVQAAAISSMLFLMPALISSRSPSYCFACQNIQTCELIVKNLSPHIRT